GPRAARRRRGPGSDPRRPPVHHAVRRAGLDLRPAGTARRPAADALRAARVAVPEPALLAEPEPTPPAVPPARGSAELARAVSVRRHDLPPDGAPHRRRHDADGA